MRSSAGGSPLAGQHYPKLHVVERHVVPAIRRYGVGLGLLGEQGGESLHAEFNGLSTAFSGVVCKVDRLAMTVKQHSLTTFPQQLAKIPQPQRRRRRT